MRMSTTPPRLAAAVLLAALAVATAAEPLRLVVSTSMIEAAARALTAGQAAAPEVVRLLPPGSCPGHFDLSARDLARVAAADLFLRHDYQAALAEKVAGLAGGGPRQVALSTPGSLLVPAHFLDLSRQVRVALAAGPADAAALSAAWTRLGEESAALTAEARRQAEPWQGLAVVASVQQREFCEWLGLRVVGALPRAEDLAPRDLAALQRSGARAVVGNLQSDARPARALGERLHLPVAILSNFPDSPDGGREAYARLLRSNLQELQRACQSPSPN